MRPKFLCILKQKNMGLLSFLGLGQDSEQVQQYLNEGALILDVRSRQEFNSGHVKGSKNIPLPELAGKIKSLKNKRIVTVCLSGGRSGSAASTLKNNGVDAINGGPWTSVNAMV